MTDAPQIVDKAETRARQSSPVLAALDCFAALAMTKLGAMDIVFGECDL